MLTGSGPLPSQMDFASAASLIAPWRLDFVPGFTIGTGGIEPSAWICGRRCHGADTRRVNTSPMGRRGVGEILSP